jgi:hypothetical protein
MSGEGGRHLTGRLGANYRSLPNIRAVTCHMTYDVICFAFLFFFLIFLVARRVTSMAPEKNVVSADALACFDNFQNETGVVGNNHRQEKRQNRMFCKDFYAKKILERA